MTKLHLIGSTPEVGDGIDQVTDRVNLMAVQLSDLLRSDPTLRGEPPVVLALAALTVGAQIYGNVIAATAYRKDKKLPSPHVVDEHLPGAQRIVAMNFAAGAEQLVKTILETSTPADQIKLNGERNG